MKIFILIALFVFLLAPDAWAETDIDLSSNPDVQFCESDDQSRPVISALPEFTEILIIKSAETGEEHRFNVEVAATPEVLMQGLMYRSALSLPSDYGMLFLFAEERPRNFWMKDTYLPLDIIFIKANNVIHHIHEGAAPLDETSIPSKGPVLSVLEINSGLTRKLGIKVGDIISLTGETNSLAR